MVNVVDDVIRPVQCHNVRTLENVTFVTDSLTDNSNSILIIDSMLSLAILPGTIYNALGMLNG